MARIIISAKSKTNKSFNSYGLILAQAAALALDNNQALDDAATAAAQELSLDEPQKPILDAVADVAEEASVKTPALSDADVARINEEIALIDKNMNAYEAFENKLMELFEDPLWQNAPKTQAEPPAQVVIEQPKLEQALSKLPEEVFLEEGADDLPQEFKEAIQVGVAEAKEDLADSVLENFTKRTVDEKEAAIASLRDLSVQEHLSEMEQIRNNLSSAIRLAYYRRMALKKQLAPQEKKEESNTELSADPMKMWDDMDQVSGSTSGSTSASQSSSNSASAPL